MTNFTIHLTSIWTCIFFQAAKEFDVGSGRKAIVIFVPFPQIKAWQKIQQKVVRELEKKFPGKHVVIQPELKKKNSNFLKKKNFEKNIKNFEKKNVFFSDASCQNQLVKPEMKNRSGHLAEHWLRSTIRFLRISVTQPRLSENVPVFDLMLHVC